ncbi:restriction endonuclease [Lacticaseibacillus absianus]|uniref:restriction endonuclease n=1 Tax=Lacticaseibacillus absianus TaxID=2729623 RepID=UPI0015C742A0|nr:restriction endonuclease [Lacticaseibacillus absianus]
MTFNYKDLKIGKHGIPTWDGMIPVIMFFAAQQKTWQGSDLTDAVVDEIELPLALREKGYDNYPKEKIVNNRIHWALSDLALSGLLRRPKRGVYEITPLGHQLNDQYGRDLAAKIIHAQPAYLAHQEELAKHQTSPEGALDEGEDDTTIAKIDRIQAQIEAYNAEIATDLLDRIREAEPTFFENLVADLLRKMGYQGPNGDATVTSASHDGGIDGIINQDPLGTSTVYYQAKRYQADNVVQRPAIQGFYGALSNVHADRGVFITTSSFTQGAKDQAKSFAIVLIDGTRLTELLLHYHVGVQAKKNYDLFQIDEDYFE